MHAYSFISLIRFVQGLWLDEKTATRTNLSDCIKYIDPWAHIAQKKNIISQRGKNKQKQKSRAWYITKYYFVHVCFTHIFMLPPTGEPENQLSIKAEAVIKSKRSNVCGILAVEAARRETISIYLSISFVQSPFLFVLFSCSFVHFLENSCGYENKNWSWNRREDSI